MEERGRSQWVTGWLHLHEGMASDGAVRDSTRRALRRSEARSGRVQRERVRAADPIAVAAELIAARLAAGAAPSSDDVVRVYHLAKTQYVRDPRTNHREGRVREVLDGAIDAFLVAYLAQDAPHEDSGVSAEVAAGVARNGNDD